MPSKPFIDRYLILRSEELFGSLVRPQSMPKLLVLTVCRFTDVEVI